MLKYTVKVEFKFPYQAMISHEEQAACFSDTFYDALAVGDTRMSQSPFVLIIYSKIPLTLEELCEDVNSRLNGSKEIKIVSLDEGASF